MIQEGILIKKSLVIFLTRNLILFHIKSQNCFFNPLIRKYSFSFRNIRLFNHSLMWSHTSKLWMCSINSLLYLTTYKSNIRASTCQSIPTPMSLFPQSLRFDQTESGQNITTSWREWSVSSNGGLTPRIIVQLMQMWLTPCRVY